MSVLLVAAALVLIGIIIIQIARASELLSVVKGEQEGEVTEDTNRSVSIFLFGFMIVGLIASVWTAYAYSDMFLPEASSVHGVELDGLFNMTLFFTGIVFIITQILLFAFVFFYRGTKERKATFFAHNNKLEVIWTAVPAVVMTVLVIFGLKAWMKTTGPAPEDALEMEAIAEQFQWTIRHSGKDGKLGKRSFDLITPENPLGIDWEDENSHDDFLTTEPFLPVDKPVLFRLGSKDVLHSFYLPHFRVKMDCVPGIPTQFWFLPRHTTDDMREKTNDPDFTFVLACAELCGSAHWNMRRDLIVVSEEEYLEWFNKQEPMYNTIKASLNLETDSDISMENSGNEAETPASVL